ncbi:hypothetical protein AC138_13560 [Pseudomonas putida]|nr:hypothetical protein AC138_13560 [Pseudomonas putida]
MGLIVSYQRVEQGLERMFHLSHYSIRTKSLSSIVCLRSLTHLREHLQKARKYSSNRMIQVRMLKPESAMLNR